MEVEQRQRDAPDKSAATAANATSNEEEKRGRGSACNDAASGAPMDVDEVAHAREETAQGASRATNLGAKEQQLIAREQMAQQEYTQAEQVVQEQVHQL